MIPRGGLWVALATPFQDDGAIDGPAFAALVDRVRRGGAEALVALGSTGEAAALSDAERDLVVERTVAAAGETPVVVGTGASCTAAAVELSRRAHERGAAGALVVVPPYVKPTQAGIVAHYEALAAAVPDLPLVAYNVPGRTGVNLLPDTVQQLWRIPTLVALKESSGDTAQLAAIARAAPPDRSVLAGDDHLVVESIRQGAAGAVSVAGNVAPQALAGLVAAARAGDWPRAATIHDTLQPLFAALGAEPNPIPVKAALALLGVCTDALRLPLLPAAQSTREHLRAALARVDPAALEVVS